MKFLLLLLLLVSPAAAAQLQSGCRGAGSIGAATMSADGTITLVIHAPATTAESVLAYRRGDAQYARILSHIGGIRPGEHKPVPPW